jgi:hypothetical protein
MAGRYEKAELLAALWRLGRGNEDRIPTSHGILDRALRECLTSLPVELRDGLSFGVTTVGLRCYELPDILLAAQEAEFTTEPNPTYLSSMVNLDETAARQIVVAHGLSTENARKIGGILKESVSAMRRRSAEMQVQPETA